MLTSCCGHRNTLSEIAPRITQCSFDPHRSYRLSDGWTFKKKALGQKGADWANDLVPLSFSAARMTTERANSRVDRYFLESRFSAACHFDNQLEAQTSDRG
jgi:hypothetical protein